MLCSVLCYRLRCAALCFRVMFCYCGVCWVSLLVRKVSQWVADNELAVSKYADSLDHVDSGRKISSDPKTWVCEDSGKTENLWLNLSTGM